MSTILSTASLLLAVLASGVAWSAEPGPLAVGSPAPEWAVENWLDSEPMTLAGLRGKVLLIRWWTSPECPYCRATAPALNEFHDAYKQRGLQVVGFYTHKRLTALDLDDVKKFAELYAFKFPVAVDPSMQTLKQWWLAGDRKKFTSVSFLIDRKGIVQYIHQGGQYVKGDGDYAAIKAKIESLLDDK